MTRPVERARRGAAALERATERAIGGFAAVVAVAAVAALGFWLGTGAGAASALGVAAAVLLVGCPRVVGRAVGTALVAGTARAVRLGALVDGPRTAEALARVDTVVLCRTGTVTTGARSLTAVHVAEGVDADEALRIAGAVASAGRKAGGATGGHPIGAVVADAARDRFGELPGVAEFDGYPALGVRGIVTELHIGCRRRAARPRARGTGRPRRPAHGARHRPARRARRRGDDGPRGRSDGGRGVVGRGRRAVLEVDRPAPARARRRPLDALRELGLSTVLLTGDDAGAARGLATALGVEEVVAGGRARRPWRRRRPAARGRAHRRGRRRTGRRGGTRRGRRRTRPARRGAARAGPGSSLPDDDPADGRRRPADGPRDGAHGRAHAHRRRGVPPGRGCPLAAAGLLPPARGGRSPRRAIPWSRCCTPPRCAGSRALPRPDRPDPHAADVGWALPAGRVCGHAPGQRPEAAAMTEAPARGVRLSRSARRAQLLVAARDVFAAQGYHAAAMDDIAERAGVSKPVLYQHFPGKLELYRALLTTCADDLVERVRDAIGAPSDNQRAGRTRRCRPTSTSSPATGRPTGWCSSRTCAASPRPPPWSTAR